MEKIQVSVSFSEWIGHSPIRLGIEKGIFSKAGVEVVPKLVSVGAHKEREQLFLKNEVDFVAQSLPSAIRVISNNPNSGRMLFLECYSPGSDGVAAKEDIQSVKDLKNKKVAYKEGVYQFYLGYLLGKNGLNFKDIFPFPCNSGEEMRDKLLSGEVDAASLWEPFLSQLGNSKDIHKLITTKEDFGDMFSVILVDYNLLRSQPDIVDKFVQAYFECVDFVSNNRELTSEFYSNELDIQVEEAFNILTDFEFLSVKNNKYYFDKNKDNNIYEVVKISEEVAEEMGDIKKIPDFGNLFDLRYI